MTKKFIYNFHSPWFHGESFSHFFYHVNMKKIMFVFTRSVLTICEIIWSNFLQQILC
jgi:hypothetical protein